MLIGVRNDYAIRRLPSHEEIALWDALLAAETKLEAERWRSVEKDGLPESDGLYVVRRSRSSVKIAEAEWHEGEFWNPRNYPWTIMSDVTHWKPIVPPSEESK